MEKIEQALLESASAGVDLQKEDGSMPAGCNGPYQHRETPVRNSGYWLQIFIWAYNKTKFENYRRSAEQCTKYLLSDEVRPHGHTFEHRIEESKNNCNSLIGQAWTIEALCCAKRELQCDEAFEIAEEVFLDHRFDERFGLWSMTETDGTNLGVCRTFNQQLWFAVAGGLLGALGSKKAKKRAELFLDKLDDHIKTNDHGQIEHLLYSTISLSDIPQLFLNKTGRALPINYLLYPLRSRKSKHHIEQQSLGYHSFNLYGLAHLYNSFNEHPVWNHQTIQHTIDYTTYSQYQSSIAGNKFAFNYNPTGIEIAYTLQTFGQGDDSDIQHWVDWQFEETYDKEVGLMNKGPDPHTLSGRLYQAIPLISTC